MKAYSTQYSAIKHREYRAKNPKKFVKYSRDYRKKNPEKYRLWNYAHGLKRRYGLTPKIVNQMWKDQVGACACCHQKMKRGGQVSNSACIDHNHTTGKVRAILCRECNLGVAQFKEDPERCELAAAYLRKHLVIKP